MNRDYWIIGMGYWGTILLKKLVAKKPNGNIRILDFDQSRVETLATSEDRVTPVSWEYLIENGKKDDQYFVATPPTTHFEIVNKLLSNGFSVWCEKPLTMDASQAKILIEKANLLKVCLFIDNTFLFDESIIKLKDMLKGKEILSANFIRHGNGKILHGIGVAWDLLPHDLSIISFLFGTYDLDSVSNFVKCKSLNSRSTLIELDLKLKNKQNFPISISLSCISGIKTRTIRIVHSKGVINYDLKDGFSTLSDLSWSNFPNNDYSSIMHADNIFTSKSEPLLNAMLEFEKLSDKKMLHESISTTIKELSLIQEIDNYCKNQISNT